MQEFTFDAEFDADKESAKSYMGGWIVRYRFPNGWGASIIRNAMSYGRESGAFELAVLDAAGHLTYDSGITDDVIGWLDTAGVEDLLRQIRALPSKVTAQS